MERGENITSLAEVMITFRLWRGVLIKGYLRSSDCCGLHTTKKVENPWAKEILLNRKNKNKHEINLCFIPDCCCFFLQTLLTYIPPTHTTTLCAVKGYFHYSFCAFRPGRAADAGAAGTLACRQAGWVWHRCKLLRWDAASNQEGREVALPERPGLRTAAPFVSACFWLLFINPVKPQHIPDCHRRRESCTSPMCVLFVSLRGSIRAVGIRDDVARRCSHLV